MTPIAPRSPLRRLLLLTVALGAASCGDGSTEPNQEDLNPLPAVLSASPAGITVDTEPPLVMVRGSGFISGSRGRISGSDRQTTFENDTTLQVQLTAADVGSVASLPLTVVNPAPGGGVSGTLRLAIGYPTPVIVSLAPSEIELGQAAPLVVFTGTGFLPSSEVRFQGIPMQSIYVSATEIRAQLLGHMVAEAAARSVSIVNPSPGGFSNTVLFSVKNRVPVLSSATPDSLFRGNGPDTVTLSGQDFVPGSVVQFDGVACNTTFVDGVTLRAVIPAAALTSVRTAALRVVNPTPGGGISAAIPVDVVVPPPTVTLLQPGSVSAGAAGFTLNVSGTDFQSDAIIEVNGVVRATTFVSATQVSTPITASDVLSAGSLAIVVRNPARGTATTTVGLPILPLAPTIGAPTVVDLVNNHVIADPVRSLIYASVPSTVALIGNTVTRIDPLTGAILGSVFVGSEPGRMAVSDDGQFLYVALLGASGITRVRLSDFQKDLDIIVLPAGTFLRPVRVEDLEVIPGSPTLVAASLSNICCSPRHEGVYLFSGATRLPVSTPDHTGSNRITVSSSGSEIFGYNNETSEFGFRRISVSADGLRQVQVVRSSCCVGIDIEFSGGRVYGAGGAVMSTTTLTSVGTIAANGSVRPDAARGRVHFLSEGALSTYHYTSFLLLGTANVPDAVGLNTVTRWGSDGLVFGGGARIVLVRGSLIGP
ncbi:MAG: YncE family protein [Gemmatimonadaceae bacterium]